MKKNHLIRTITRPLLIAIAGTFITHSSARAYDFWGGGFTYTASSYNGYFGDHYVDYNDYGFSYSSSSSSSNSSWWSAPYTNHGYDDPSHHGFINGGSSTNYLFGGAGSFTSFGNGSYLAVSDPGIYGNPSSSGGWFGGVSGEGGYDAYDSGYSSSSDSWSDPYAYTNYDEEYFYSSPTYTASSSYGAAGGMSGGDSFYTTEEVEIEEIVSSDWEDFMNNQWLEDEGSWSDPYTGETGYYEDYEDYMTNENVRYYYDLFFNVIYEEATDLTTGELTYSSGDPTGSFDPVAVMTASDYSNHPTYNAFSTTDSTEDSWESSWSSWWVE